MGYSLPDSGLVCISGKLVGRLYPRLVGEIQDSVNFYTKYSSYNKLLSYLLKPLLSNFQPGVDRVKNPLINGAGR